MGSPFPWYPADGLKYQYAFTYSMVYDSLDVTVFRVY
jgi:hypothetical protein